MNKLKIKVNNEWIPISGGNNSNKNAMVFGDSYFENRESANYAFGDWLKDQNIYSQVFDYAYEGTGFGNTYEYTKGHNLYELIKGTYSGTAALSAEICEKIALTDDIFIHIGGNDILSHSGMFDGLNPIAENNLAEKIKEIFDKIYILNPNATIYYIIPYRINMMSSVTDNTQWSALPAALRVYLIQQMQIIRRTIADCDNNIFISDFTLSDFIYHFNNDTDFHPNKASAYFAYKKIINGNYLNKKMNEIVIFANEANQPALYDLRQAIDDFTNNRLTIENDMSLFMIPIVTQDNVPNGMYINELKRFTYGNIFYSFYMLMPVQESSILNYFLFQLDNQFEKKISATIGYTQMTINPAYNDLINSI